jgi:hypothetical protein
MVVWCWCRKKCLSRPSLSGLMMAVVDDDDTNQRPGIHAMPQSTGRLAWLDLIVRGEVWPCM